MHRSFTALRRGGPPRSPLAPKESAALLHVFIYGMLNFLAQAAPAASTAASEATKSLQDTAGQAGYTVTSGDLPALIGKIIEAALGLVGFVFLGLILYGGFLWMFAQGDSTKVEKARNVLIYATIGLVIIAAAYALTNFIFTQILSSV